MSLFRSLDAHIERTHSMIWRLEKLEAKSSPAHVIILTELLNILVVVFHARLVVLRSFEPREKISWHLVPARGLMASRDTMSQSERG